MLGFEEKHYNFTILKLQPFLLYSNIHIYIFYYVTTILEKSKGGNAPARPLPGVYVTSIIKYGKQFKSVENILVIIRNNALKNLKIKVINK